VESSPLGPGEYTYQSSGLSRIGIGVVLFGIAWAGFSAFWLFGVLWLVPHQPYGPTGSPPIIMPIGGFLFFAAGIGFIVTGVRYIQSANNECVTITPTEIAYTDRSGVERVRVPFNMITHVQETISQQMQIQIGQRSGGPIHHKCIVDTPAGSFVFSDAIDDYELLRDFLLSKETQHVQKGSFGYRSSGFAIFAVAMILVALGILVASSIAFFSHVEMNINNEVQPMPPSAYAFLLFWSVIWGSAFSWLLLHNLNERVVIVGDHLQYFDWRGRKKVDVPLEWVEKGSYKVLSGMRSNSKKFEVQTPQGRVGWSDDMQGCTDLCGILEKASAAPQARENRDAVSG